MVEPMSPRFASAMVRMPADRASASTRSSAAKPAEPCRSKNDTCGLTMPARPWAAPMTRRPNSRAPIGVVLETPAVEQPGVRIDSDAEVAEAVERRTEPVAEGGHAHAIAAARCSAYSCSEVTSKPPRTASSDPTAADSSAMVVNSGMSPATAAARIS